MACPQWLILSALLAGVLMSPAVAFHNIRILGHGPLAGLIPIHPSAASGVSEMDFVEDTVNGTLTITDSGTPVLTYRFGDQLKEGVDARFARSCYIHPLYSLDGRELTTTSGRPRPSPRYFLGLAGRQGARVTTSNWEVGRCRCASVSCAG